MPLLRHSKPIPPARPKRFPVIRTLAFAMALFSLALPACTNSGPAPEPLASPAVMDGDVARIEVQGKLRDVGPALRVALSRMDLAPFHERPLLDAGRIEFDLVGLADEEGYFLVTFNPITDSLIERRTIRPLTLETQVDRFGDAERSRELVESAAREILRLAKEP